MRFLLSFFRILKDVGIDVLVVDFRHQGMDDADDGVEVSEEEFDSRSKSNVDHWVSVHVIPVCFNLNLLAMELMLCIFRKRLYLWIRSMRLCCAESRSPLHPYQRMTEKGQSGAVSRWKMASGFWINERRVASFSCCRRLTFVF